MRIVVVCIVWHCNLVVRVVSAVVVSEVACQRGVFAEDTSVDYADGDALAGVPPGGPLG